MRRIIPARAGQTSVAFRSSLRLSDHPRACGASFHVRKRFGFAHGSSPRVRGKQERRHGQPVERRIIPARAGQTIAHVVAVDVTADHPRACGANFFHNCSVVCFIGSSPRVRGKPGHTVERVTHGRIIPARAGQTRKDSKMIQNVSDHPRACGANIAAAVLFSVLFGSSPRVRGKRTLCLVLRHRPRIIPARAGQTSWHQAAPAR